MSFEFIYFIIVLNEPCRKSKTNSCSKSLPSNYYSQCRYPFVWCKPSIGQLRRRITQKRLPHRTNNLPSSTYPKAIINKTFDAHSHRSRNGSDQHCISTPVFINNKITWKGKTYINSLVYNWKSVDHCFTVTVKYVDLFGDGLYRNPGDLVEHGAQSKN